MNRISMNMWKTSRSLFLPRNVHVPQTRFSSSQTPTPSPTRAFYKTFTRPVAKVLLMATFTYQLFYWGWVKLEKDELKRMKQEVIKELEGRLEEVSEGKVKGEDIRVRGL